MKYQHFAANLAIVAALGAGLTSVAQAQVDEQFVMLPSYRVGAYGSNGAAIFGGIIDYFNYVNRNGGVNGVRLSWEECETEYNTARGVECYERLKTRHPVTKGTVAMPFSTGISYAVMDKATVDKVPVLMMGYGLTAAVNGRMFPYGFPLVTTYQMQASAMLKFIAGKLGGKSTADLDGKKIAFIYHDSAYGKEPLPVLRAEAALNNFSLLEIPVTHPGNEQGAQWLRVRRERPDFVIFWGWGIMNTTGIRAAAKVGFPRNRMLGVWWSGSEEDTVPAGEASKGYYATNFGKTGRDIPLIQNILKTIYKDGEGNMADEDRVGTVLYSRGVLNALLVVEALKTAQTKFGNRVISSTEMQWGLENLKITNTKLKKLGAEGMVDEFEISCMDHEGSGRVLFQQWDGNQWNLVSGYVEGNRKLVQQLLSAEGARIARERGITPRTDC